MASQFIPSSSPLTEVSVYIFFYNFVFRHVGSALAHLNIQELIASLLSSYTDVIGVALGELESWRHKIIIEFRSVVFNPGTHVVVEHFIIGCLCLVAFSPLP